MVHVSIAHKYCSDTLCGDRSTTAHEVMPEINILRLNLTQGMGMKRSYGNIFLVLLVMTLHSPGLARHHIPSVSYPLCVPNFSPDYVFFCSRTEVPEFVQNVIHL